jgi:PAS domain S-box-containing protein
MPPKKRSSKPSKKQSSEIEELRVRLDEANETLRVIREGEVDAVIVSGSRGEQVFSLAGADSIYRLIVETMNEAAFTATFDGQILYCNAQFGEFIKRPINQILGSRLHEFVDPANRSAADALLTTAREQSVKQRLTFANADGCLVPVHISANLLNQPDGLSICVVATDLTDLENSTEMIHRLRQQQEQLQAAHKELAANAETIKRANDELEERVRERTEQLRALVSELTLAEQRERKRLALVLHDHIQQLLVAAKFRLAVLGRDERDTVKQATREIDELIDESIAESRSLAAELSPPVLHESGLNAGLEWLARWMQDKQHLHVDLELDAIDPLTETANILLFESVRELLLNSVKHSQTHTVRISLRSAEDLLQLVVSDEGVGFDPKILPLAGESGSGFGLFSISERLQLLGGRIEIDSSPGKGSRVALRLPIAQYKTSIAGRQKTGS